jgi:hypothetical protein
MGVVLFGRRLDSTRIICTTFVVVEFIGLKAGRQVSLYAGKGETPMTCACPPSISA